MVYSAHHAISQPKPLNGVATLHSTTLRSKALCVFLAAALALAFAPIAGCKSEEPLDDKTEEAPAKTEPAAAQPTSASEDPGGNAEAATIDYDTSTYLAPEKKWAEFDDGAPVLDIVQTHINANANKQTLTVRLERPGVFSNKGLIDVYDGMAASAYNWKAAAAGVRTQYRKAVGDAWGSGSAVLLSLLGTPSYSASYGGVLANLQSDTKMVSKAIDSGKDDLNSHTVEAGAYELVSKNGLVKPTGKAYFCYTTNEWYTFCTGSMSTVKWDRAFAKSKKRGRVFDYDADMPFIAWHNDSTSPKWESVYMSTTGAKSLVARSAGNRSLHSEIAMFHPDMPRYILTSVSLDLKPAAQPKNNNIWRSDTFERTSDSVTELKENMIHFDGHIKSWAFKKSEKVSVSSTEPGDMAVIAKVTLE